MDFPPPPDRDAAGTYATARGSAHQLTERLSKRAIGVMVVVGSLTALCAFYGLLLAAFVDDRAGGGNSSAALLTLLLMTVTPVLLVVGAAVALRRALRAGRPALRYPLAIVPPNVALVVIGFLVASGANN